MISTSALSSHHIHILLNHQENLDDVGRGIAMLKDMALDMGTTIDEHNDRIGRITDKVMYSWFLTT